MRLTKQLERDFFNFVVFTNHFIMKTIFFTVFTLLSSAFTFGQDDWLRFPPSTTDSAKADRVKLDYSQNKGKVTVHKDARLDKIAEFVRTGEESIEGVKIEGYRIVIFFDQDKSEVEGQKAVFLSRYSEHKAYVDYLAPNYRVRVGNFRTRLEAEALKDEILSYFPTAVVVEDRIQLPKLPAVATPLEK